MIIGNRFHAVRGLGPLSGGLGRRYILERRRAQWPARLVPDGPDWVTLPSGVVVPAIAGGAGGTYLQGYENMAFPLFHQSATAGQSTLALDSNYVNNTSGDAIAARFHLRQAETLSAVRFFITAYTGTAANVNDLNVDLRANSNTTGPGGTTQHDSVTINPASATGWITTTGWTFAASADTVYWLVIGDADGNSTDFATVLRSTNTWTLFRDMLKSQAWQTTDGWSATRTAASQASGIVILFTSGRVLGSPITATAASTSSQNRRGLRFIAPAGLKLFGMTGLGNPTTTTVTGLELYADASTPGSGQLATGTTELMNQLANIGGYLWETPPSLTQGTAYRAVYVYGVNSTTPGKMNIGTGADATLRSARVGGGAWYWAEANGTTDWSNDDINATPAVELLVDDFVTEAVSAAQLVNSGALVG